MLAVGDDTMLLCPGSHNRGMNGRPVFVELFESFGWIASNKCDDLDGTRRSHPPDSKSRWRNGRKLELKLEKLRSWSQVCN
jgi:hypothetical protein